MERRVAATPVQASLVSRVLSPSIFVQETIGTRLLLPRGGDAVAFCNGHGNEEADRGPPLQRQQHWATLPCPAAASGSRPRLPLARYSPRRLDGGRRMEEGAVARHVRRVVRRLWKKRPMGMGHQQDEWTSSSTDSGAKKLRNYLYISENYLKTNRRWSYMYWYWFHVSWYFRVLSGIFFLVLLIFFTFRFEPMDGPYFFKPP